MKEFETYTETRPKVEPLLVGSTYKESNEQSIADVAEWYIRHDPEAVIATGGMRKVLARVSEDLNVKSSDVISALHLVPDVIYDLNHENVIFVSFTAEELEAVGDITFESVARDIIKKNGIDPEDGGAPYEIVNREVNRLSLMQLSVLLGVSLSGNLESIVRQVKETVLSQVLTIIKQDNYFIPRG